MSKNINCLTAQKFSTLNSTSNYNRRSAIRRRLEMNSTTSNPIENSNNNIYLQNQNSNNSITSPILIYNRHNSRQSSVNLNSSYTNPQSQFHNSQNSQTISINNDLSTSYRRRHLNRNIFISVHNIIQPRYILVNTFSHIFISINSKICLFFMADMVKYRRRFMFTKGCVENDCWRKDQEVQDAERLDTEGTRAQSRLFCSHR